jgi:uncharacterized protein DUF5333
MTSRLMSSARMSLAAVLLGAPAYAATIADDAAVFDTMVQSVVVTEVSEGCPAITVNQRRMNRLTKKMMKQISRSGYSTGQIMLLRDEAYLARIAVAADEFYRANGVVEKNESALCALGKSEIAGRTPIGKLLQE